MNNEHLPVDSHYSSPEYIYYRDNDHLHLEKITRRQGPIITISISTVALAILIILIILNVVKYFKEQETIVVETTSSSSIENEAYYSNTLVEETADSEELLVFQDSHKRIITDDEINSLGGSDNELKLELIQQSINTLYARHGYDFKEEKWQVFYDQFEWYDNKGLTDAETKERFNSIEYRNLEKLIAARKQLRGY